MLQHWLDHDSWSLILHLIKSAILLKTGLKGSPIVYDTFTKIIIPRYLIKFILIGMHIVVDTSVAASLEWLKLRILDFNKFICIPDEPPNSTLPILDYLALERHRVVRSLALFHLHSDIQSYIISCIAVKG